MSQQFEIPPPQLKPGETTKPIPLSQMQPNLSDDELINLQSALSGTSPAFVQKASDVTSKTKATPFKEGVSVFPEAETPSSKEKEEDKKPKIDERELDLFWNSVLGKKPYTKTYVIKGLKITLQTRTNAQVEESLLYLDKFNDSLVTTYDYMRAKCLAAAALLRIGDDYLGSGTFEQRLEYLNSLSQIGLNIVLKCLEKFDDAVVAMEEHVYSENF